MRRTLVLIVGLAMVLTTLGPAMATHNNVGSRFVVGDPDPVPTNEPDVPEGMTIVYHTDQGGTTPFQGSYARLAPLDQSGQGMGDWIGYINGVIEHPGPVSPQCGPLVAVNEACRQNDDPLYRANPAAGDDECDDLIEDRADPERCTGSEHPMNIDFYPGAFVQANHFAPLQTPGSGFLMPGEFTHYVYLFGDGTGGVQAGQGQFSYLGTDLCETHMTELKQQGRIAENQDTSDAEKCELLTPGDLELHNTAGEGTAVGVCIFAPQFSTVTSSEDADPCPGTETVDYHPPSESSVYLSNKPGWYSWSGSLDPFGSVTTRDGVIFFDTMTKDGVRNDISQMFEYFVNPVPPADDFFCAAPFISTTAADGLDTGIEQNEDGSWSVVDPSLVYQVAGHDLDVYTGTTGGSELAGDAIDTAVDVANETSTTVFDTLDEVLDELPETPPQVGSLLEQASEQFNSTLDAIGNTTDGVSDVVNATDPIVDEATRAINRAAPFIGDATGPTHEGDNALAIQRETDVDIGVCEGGLNRIDPDGETRNYYNWFDANIAGTTLRDYTATEDDGLPKEAGDQGYNPWHPQRYTFSGTVMTFLDRTGNDALDACPLPGNDPTASQDKCLNFLAWDLYNDDSEVNSLTAGQAATADGFRTPGGLYFILKVTGPVAITTTDNAAITSSPTTQDELIERTQILSDQGQNCVVGTSKDLAQQNTPQGDDFRTVLSLDTSLTTEDLAAELCGDADGEILFLGDAFVDQNGGGDYFSGIGWSKLSPTPEATHPDTGDGLTVHALLTTQPGGDDITSGNIQLGSQVGLPTELHYWGEDDGRITYQWTDFEPFDSDPSNPE